MPYTKEQMISLLRECKRDPLMNFNVDYWDRKNKDPYEWKVVYQGPKGTPYEGGIFTVKVNIPSNYPDNDPENDPDKIIKFFFITRIYHLNIHWKESNNDGFVCFGNNYENDIKKLLKLVETFFSIQNPGSTWYGDKDKQDYLDYMEGKSKAFYEKAQNWVYLYAGLNQLKQ